MEKLESEFNWCWSFNSIKSYSNQIEWNILFFFSTLPIAKMVSKIKFRLWIRISKKRLKITHSNRSTHSDHLPNFLKQTHKCIRWLTFKECIELGMCVFYFGMFCLFRQLFESPLKKIKFISPTSEWYMCETVSFQI